MDRFNGEEKVIKNSKSAGTPRYWKVNGQALYNGNFHEMSRNKATEEVHKYIKKFIKELPAWKPKEGHFLAFGIVWCDVLPEAEESFWDCSNKWPWTKWIEDTLQEKNKIPQDSIGCVRSSGNITYVRVEKPEHKKLIIVLEEYKEEDMIDAIHNIINNSTILKYHGDTSTRGSTGKGML